MTPVVRPRALAGGVVLEIQYAHYAVCARSYDDAVPISDEPGSLALVTDVDVATVMTWSESGPLSLRVERTPGEPDPPGGTWDEVVESTVASTGPLFLQSFDGSPPLRQDTGQEVRSARLTIRPGLFGLRVSGRGRDLVENEPVAEGEEHFLQIWRIGDAPDPTSS